MSKSQFSFNESREACEAMLKKHRDSRTENHILPSEVAVIDRLLSRRLELEEAYGELYAKLANYSNALYVFF